MARKLNTKEFINKAIVKHGDKYSYDKTIYKGSKQKAIITCKIHGDFLQIPNSHLMGGGCPKCSRETIVNKTRSNTTDFVAKANKIHNNKYCYYETEYINISTKVKIICKKHGCFIQNPNDHLQGYGCPICGGSKKLTTQNFIKRSKEIHANKYDYSKTNYINSATNVIIICKEHGEFLQKPNKHLMGRGCPKCSNIKIKKSNQNIKLTTSNFITKSNKIHKNKYDYSQSRYTSNNHKLLIICPDHGAFYQLANDHLQGHGCPVCNGNIKLTTEEFINRSNIIHNFKYDYSKSEYNNGKSKILIICPMHGKFYQNASDHLQGHGCNKCAILESNPEKEISKIFSNPEMHNRELIKPYEIDIFDKENKIGVEFHGLRWHSYNRSETSKEKLKHYNKATLANDNGIFLFQIFEHEWIKNSCIIKSMINNKLNKSIRIYARKCKIIDLDNKSYKDFINHNHLYGYTTSSIKYGLLYDNKLVCVLSFKKHHKYDYEISRFANLIGHNVIGGASKLFKHFLKTYNPSSILTFADRRFSNGFIYHKLGFELVDITKPNYFYIKRKEVFSRQQFQKHKLKFKLKHFDSNLTESQNMFNNGYRRLWDAGHLKFIWKNEYE